MKNFWITAFLLLGSIAIMTSCDDDDPNIPSEEELITTVIYTLQPQGGGASTVLTFRDVDGDGGDDPIIEGGTLQANTTYSGTLEFLDESTDSTEDITEEIAEEDDEHQVFFSTTISGLTVTYDDEDENGNPLGLATTLSTGNAGSGQLTIILRHEPDKMADMVNMGNIANAGGETDIEVTFAIDVE